MQPVTCHCLKATTSSTTQNFLNSSHITIEMDKSFLMFIVSDRSVDVIASRRSVQKVRASLNPIMKLVMSENLIPCASDFRRSITRRNR